MSIVTLTTDFGIGSPYAAAMKAVVLAIDARVTLVDISHAIAAQDVRHAAVVLEQVCFLFPAGTIHVVVVDPGVGTERALVYLEIDQQHFVGPDNGVFSRVVESRQPTKQIRLTNREFWRSNVSNTFHGRDILAPVAAHLSRGIDPERLGDAHPELIRLEWPAPRVSARRIEGEVMWSDSFGNLITNIPENLVVSSDSSERPAPSGATITIQGTTIRGLSRVYGDRERGKPLALVGSNGLLEIAIAGGSAATKLQAAPGSWVVVEW